MLFYLFTFQPVLKFSVCISLLSLFSLNTHDGLVSWLNNNQIVDVYTVCPVSVCLTFFTTLFKPFWNGCHYISHVCIKPYWLHGLLKAEEYHCLYHHTITVYWSAFLLFYSIKLSMPKLSLLCKDSILGPNVTPLKWLALEGL